VQNKLRKVQGIHVESYVQCATNGPPSYPPGGPQRDPGESSGSSGQSADSVNTVAAWGSQQQPSPHNFHAFLSPPQP
jgi:hypothetical protein